MQCGMQVVKGHPAVIDLNITFEDAKVCAWNEMERMRKKAN